MQDAAEILGIQDLLERKPRQLSGGQRQRVALGRAIVRHPQVFLFDEPLSNLDAKLRVQMRVELKKLHERLGTTAIYVTHDQVEAMTLGDRVVVMKDGLVQQVGEPLELYNAPANRFVAGFIGSPAMNFAAVTRHRARRRAWAANDGSASRRRRTRPSGCAPCSAAKSTLGIRPEDLRIATAADPADFGFDALVEVVEKLGSEILLDLQVGREAMVAAVEPTVRAVHGDKLRIALNPDRAALLRRSDRRDDLTARRLSGGPNTCSVVSPADSRRSHSSSTRTFACAASSQATASARGIATTPSSSARMRSCGSTRCRRRRSRRRPCRARSRPGRGRCCRA